MPIDPYDARFKLLTRGLGGLMGYISGDATCSIPDSRLTPYFGDVVPGGYVIDKRDLLTHAPRAVEMSLHSPLVNVDLAEGEAQLCPVPEEWFANALGGMFGTLARAKVKRPTWTGLDTVCRSLYVDYWRHRGALIGVRVGNRIEWENRTPERSRTIIPDAEFRYKRPNGEIRWD